MGSASKPRPAGERLEPADLPAFDRSSTGKFLARIEQLSPGLAALLPRARFYAQGLELQWTLSGLETGETFWFTAHLGGARDIGA